MRLRRTVIATLVAAGIAVPVAATAAVAAPAGSAGSAGTSVSAGKAVTAGHKAAPKPSKTRKPVRATFAASGTVTAVDAAAGTVSVLARGGTKDVRGRTVTVAVPDTARVLVNSRRATLAVLTVGARITTTGVRVDDAYTASRVQASQKTRPVVKPTPTPTPTVSPTPTPSPTPDEDPTEAPVDESDDDLSA